MFLLPAMGSYQHEVVRAQPLPPRRGPIAQAEQEVPGWAPHREAFPAPG